MIQRTLFSTPRAANFSAATKVLEPVVTPIVWKAHKDALEDFGKRLLDDEAIQLLKNSEKAQFLHRQIVERVRRLLKSYGENVHHGWHADCNIDVLNINDEIHLCFKKLRHDLSRSNYPTPHNQAFWTQSDSARPLKLIAGYIPNAAWNNFRLYLTLPGRRGVAEWCELSDNTTQFIHIVTARTSPAQTPEPKRGFTARAKKLPDQKGKMGGQDVG